MKNLPVSHLMSTDLITVGPSTPLIDIADIFEMNNIHHVPVVENSEILGIISKSDYHKLQDHFTFFNTPAARELNEQTFSSLLAKEVMTKNLVFVKPTHLIAEVAKIFLENLFHAVPVVDEGSLVGLVTTYDFIKYCHQELLLLETK